MAEINVEKKSSPIWPWILLIIVIVAGIIWYYSYNNEDIRTNDPVEQIEDGLDDLEDKID